MAATTKMIDVNVRLPRETYDEVQRVADREQREVEDELAALIRAGLDAHRSYQELMARLSQNYRSKLEIEGKLGKSTEDVLKDLRRLRKRLV